MQVRPGTATYQATFCSSDHLTGFAGGFFVVPNTVDFEFIFANASFEDNLTIYLCIIITMILYLILTCWALWHDREDEKRLVIERRGGFLVKLFDPIFGEHLLGVSFGKMSVLGTFLWEGRGRMKQLGTRKLKKNIF